MSKEVCPLEGKIVVLRYIECDYEGEGTAYLVYRVRNSKLEQLFGVLNLLEGTHWHYSGFDINEKTLEVILKEGVSEVYTPFAGSNFLGEKLGYADISEQPNEKGEIDCWCELEGVCSFRDDEIIILLKEYGITVFYVDSQTLKVVSEVD